MTGRALPGYDCRWLWLRLWWLCTQGGHPVTMQGDLTGWCLIELSQSWANAHRHGQGGRPRQNCVMHVSLTVLRKAHTGCR